ncbi:hypothetical protein FNU76_06985 [Chitinimonas arctica]|uniref:Uncharacterized protein n=1 Tax=Chitinimonas arctica TaxID=2594795 RepID=A0A516SD93_9NEIS|nr:hypothetical protein [Chitinimonas arctica]QDQ26119.1 hypothetical protein FNU76_06985 [Chitinimonas arctica]
MINGSGPNYSLLSHIFNQAISVGQNPIEGQLAAPISQAVIAAERIEASYIPLGRGSGAGHSLSTREFLNFANSYVARVEKINQYQDLDPSKREALITGLEDAINAKYNHQDEQLTDKPAAQSGGN